MISSWLKKSTRCLALEPSGEPLSAGMREASPTEKARRGGMFLSLVLILHRPLLRGRSIRFRRRLAQIRHAVRSISRQPHRLLFGWLLGTSVQGTYILLTALLSISG